MKRVENSVRNLRYGIIFQFVGVVLKFIMRTVLVKEMGDAIVGLNGLFTEVLSMLSMAELGIGSAITFSLYKPLAEHDNDKVAKLMALYKQAYRLIALAVFAVGMILMPWIHLLVRKVDFDVSYIRLVYFLFLISSASSYLFQYKSALLTADQMTYKTTRIRIYSSSAIIILKIIALLLTHNFIVFLVVEIVGGLINNIMISDTANKAYPFLREKAPLPDKEERSRIFKNIAHIFIGKLSGKITTSTDNILISTMVSTISVGLYSNYSMVMNNARIFFGQITNATSGSIGNLMATGSKDWCYHVLKRMTMVMFIPGSILCTCFFVGLSPLIGLWLGESRVLEDSVLYVLVFNFFFFIIREPIWQFTTSAGLFSIDKNISITGSVVNLILSIILGFKLGMLGIFIGTTATLIIQLVLKTLLLCRKSLERSPKDYYLYILGFMVVTAAACIGCKALTNMIRIDNGWIALIVNLAVTALVTLALDYAVYCRSDEMKYCQSLVFGKLKNLLKR